MNRIQSKQNQDYSRYCCTLQMMDSQNNQKGIDG